MLGIFHRAGAADTTVLLTEDFAGRIGCTASTVVVGNRAAIKVFGVGAGGTGAACETIRLTAAIETQTNSAGTAICVACASRTGRIGVCFGNTGSVGAVFPGLAIFFVGTFARTTGTIFTDFSVFASDVITRRWRCAKTVFTEVLVIFAGTTGTAGRTFGNTDFLAFANGITLFIHTTSSLFRVARASTGKGLFPLHTAQVTLTLFAGFVAGFAFFGTVVFGDTDSIVAVVERQTDAF